MYCGVHLQCTLSVIVTYNGHDILLHTPFISFSFFFISFFIHYPHSCTRLASERYKTKVVYESLSPRWQEQFEMFLYDDQSQELEVTVWDKDQRSKDDFMGRTSLDLSGLQREKTHQIWLNLEDGAGKLFLLVTISGDL